MARKPKGAAQCSAKCKATGNRCRRAAVAGRTKCIVHGVGTRKRVQNGTRKPAGRQVNTGVNADPAKPKPVRLMEIIAELRSDPKIRDATEDLIMVKAAMRWQAERIQNGEFDVMKAKDLPEDPATWLIHQGKLVIDATAKACQLTYADKFKAACALLDPALKVVQNVIFERVTDKNLRAAIFDAIQTGLAELLVPAGGGTEG